MTKLRKCLADHHHDRSIKLSADQTLRQFRDGRNDPGFVRPGCARDRDGGRRRIEPGGDGARAPVRRASSSACRRCVVAAGSARLRQSISVGSSPSRAVAGDILHAPRQLHAASARRRACCGALRGGDAGHDFDRDTGLAAGRDLLAGAAEDHRIAALEPHHARPGLARLTIRALISSCLQDGPMAGLADHHLLRLAPREIEDLRRHQIVEQDDVGGLQRAHRAQASSSSGSPGPAPTRVTEPWSRAFAVGRVPPSAADR